MAIGHRLDPDKMRPGQLWTKHQNMCMRAKKLSSFSCRISNVKFDNQALLLLRDYAEKGNMELMKEYKFDAKDIDVLNHISPLRKLGPKLVAAIKKAL
jgi:hypothetical protein